MCAMPLCIRVLLIHTQVRLALATLLLNFATSLLAHRGGDVKLQCTSLCVELLSNERDGEVACVACVAMRDARCCSCAAAVCSLRALVALGTLLHQDEECKRSAADCDVRSSLQTLTTHADERVKQAASGLLASL